LPETEPELIHILTLLHWLTLPATITTLISQTMINLPPQDIVNLFTTTMALMELKTTPLITALTTTPTMVLKTTPPIMKVETISTTTMIPTENRHTTKITILTTALLPTMVLTITEILHKIGVTPTTTKTLQNREIEDLTMKMDMNLITEINPMATIAPMETDPIILPMLTINRVETTPLMALTTYLLT
jgi:hypothetical protein